MICDMVQVKRMNRKQEKRSKNRIVGSLRSRAGFSLVEMMVAIAVVGLLSALLAVGVRLSVSAYARVVDEANARVLLSTTLSHLRIEFSEAKNIQMPAVGADGVEPVKVTELTYQDRTTGIRKQMYLEGEAQEVYALPLTEDIDDASVSDPAKNPYSLTAALKSGSAGKYLYVTYDSITYDSAAKLVTVKGLSVKKMNGTLEPLAEDPIRTIPEYVIRVQ